MVKPSRGDKILEIGCGWGGFSEFLAKRRDVIIDCITISRKQYDYTKERMCINEDEVVELFKSYGYKEVFCENLSMININKYENRS